MTAEQPRADKQVRVQIDRLVNEDGGQHPREEIERLAQESVAELEGAPVQQYVPNLVYNDVKNRLREESSWQEGESA